jgi:hypothetical protein
MANSPLAVGEAASKGILARLTSEMRWLLLSSGHLSRVPVGTILCVAEGQPQFLGLILDGFLRVFVAGRLLRARARSATSDQEISSGLSPATIRYLPPLESIWFPCATRRPSPLSDFMKGEAC